MIIEILSMNRDDDGVWFGKAKCHACDRIDGLTLKDHCASDINYKYDPEKECTILTCHCGNVRRVPGHPAKLFKEAMEEDKQFCGQCGHKL